MNIRLAKIEDKEQALKILDELLVEDALSKGIKPDHTPVVEAGDKMFDEFLEREDWKVFVAEESGKIVGVATMYLFPVLRRGDFRAQLEELVVSKDQRGHGIGTSLVKAVMEWCKENQISVLRINSSVTLLKAHEFYESLGGELSEKSFRFDIK